MQYKSCSTGKRTKRTEEENVKKNRKYLSRFRRINKLKSAKCVCAPCSIVCSRHRGFHSIPMVSFHLDQFLFGFFYVTIFPISIQFLSVPLHFYLLSMIPVCAFHRYLFAVFQFHGAYDKNVLNDCVLDG